MPASQQSHGALINVVRRPEHDFDLWSDSVRSSTSLRLVDQNVISPVAGAHLRLTLLWTEGKMPEFWVSSFQPSRPGARNAPVLGFKRLSTLPRRFGAINHVCLKRRDKLL